MSKDVVIVPGTTTVSRVGLHRLTGSVQWSDGQNLPRKVEFKCESAVIDGPVLHREYGHGGKHAAVTAYCTDCGKESGFRVTSFEVVPEPPMDI